MRNIPRTLLFLVFVLALLMFSLAVLLMSSLEQVQARRFFRGGAGAYYHIINSCTDGVELGFAINQSEGSDPNNVTETITTTGTLLLDNTTVLSTSFTLTKDPGALPTCNPENNECVSAFGIANWTKALDPGSRVALQLDMSVGGGLSRTVYFSVHDCVLTELPPRPGPKIFPDSIEGTKVPSVTLPFQGGYGPSCISSTMVVTKTAPIHDLDVAMWITHTNSLTGQGVLSATLTSPEGTKVKLFEGIGGEGIGFGSRCKETLGESILDPMADFVLADDSVFDFGTVTVTAPYTKTAVAPLEPLGVFGGENMSGTWTLDICNSAPIPDDGLGCWYMEIWEVVPPAVVDIVGPTAGSTGVTHHFTATVDPVSTTLPLTYTWLATGQEPIIDVMESLTDTAALTWNLAGSKVVTVTAENVGGVMTDTHVIEIQWPPAAPTAVDISGATYGLIDTGYELGANVSPISTTLPLTYTWLAAGQEPIVDVAERLTDTATFNWTTAGTKLVIVTAENGMGLVADTHVLTITAAPVAPTAVDISGPTLGIRDAAIDFSATVSPISATQPFTYTWLATGQTPVVHRTVSPIDGVTFSWNVTGTKSIIVTAENAGGTVINTYAVTIGHGVFVPAIFLMWPE